MSLPKVSLASWFTISLLSMPQWFDTQQKQEVDTRASVTEYLEEGHVLANEMVFIIFALHCLQERQWVAVYYNNMLFGGSDNSPVPGDDYSLSSKANTVIWESLGQLEAGRLTILEWRLMIAAVPTVSLILDLSM